MMNKRIAIAASLTLALAAGIAGATTADLAGVVLGPDEVVVSFDWGADGSLYYGVGDKNYGLGFEVRKFDGSATTTIYSSATFAGPRVTAIGNHVYFNDGGDFGRWTYDYYKYDTIAGGAATQLIASSATNNYWGLATRDGTDLWASGGWSSSIHRGELDAGGELIALPLANLGAIGNSSGPVAFDAAGNLYYAEGWVAAGTPNVYRWTAAEVADAVAGLGPLDPAGHVWASIAGGFTGATGMAIDDDGNVVLTATSWGMASQLHRYSVDAAGVNDGYHVLLSDPMRLDTVRVRDGLVYVAHGDGIGAVVPEPITMLGLAVGLGGLARYVRRRRRS